ncbi:MAG: flagellar basal body P-ring protein FlgI [Thermogutta sp.]|nr:flagellar basal body P-ring protein FlgI [Thermogutta sp.]HOP76073.1 flagellar basal body P-ring protein FlgI [Thermogutta sp.]HPU05691.1 flagellar basal body P-ring protein FlgI [Thermogutta sp.]
MTRRVVILGTTLIFAAGCSLWFNSKKASSLLDPVETKTPSLVGDLAVPYGLHPIVVEAIGLVTGLNGTGSDPLPSPERQFLLTEMQRRGVQNPNRVLASKNTALVLVRGYLRPGIQKGENFDVEVRVPSRSETTSLRGGTLLEVPLREMMVLRGAVREGHILAKAAGPVLVDPSADPEKDAIYATRGRILGGGTADRSRTLGLVLKPDHQSVMNSARIESAINRRFYVIRQGVQEGVARAKTNEYVEVRLHPRYKNNIARYMAVVRSIPLRDTEPERLQRLRDLEEELLNPATSEQAALQLEAIGQPAVETLKKGLTHADPAVRFYSAEALAYLDCAEAAGVLGEIARNEPAFRVYALAALSTLNDLETVEILHDLLTSPSAETRYGAFRALVELNPNDSVIAGEKLNDQFWYHVLRVSGPPMVHVTRNRRAEVVLFGPDITLKSPFALEAGHRIMVTSQQPGKVTVAKFAVNEADQKRFVSNNLDEIIRAVAELGGTYPDVVQMLQQAKAAGVLEARFEVEAIPETGRKYQGPSEDESPSPDVAPLVKKYEELPGGGDVTTDHALPGPEFDASAIDTEPTPAEEQNVSETSKKGRSWWPFGGTKTSS